MLTGGIMATPQFAQTSHHVYHLGRLRPTTCACRSNGFTETDNVAARRGLASSKTHSSHEKPPGLPDSRSRSSDPLNLQATSKSQTLAAPLRSTRVVPAVFHD